MGKLKKNRKARNARVNPVARKDGSTKQDLKEESTRQNKIVPLISKLSSSAPNDRSMAISAIMVLAEDPKMRRLLLKERLVATVMEKTLNDNNEEIVVELFGLLRNLTIEEGHEVAKHLWRLNIWAAIEKGLETIESSFDFINKNSEKKMEKKRALMLYDFTENLLSLVVAIASSSEELFDQISGKIDRTLKLVLALITFNTPKLKTSLKLFNALLELLYEFASESADFVARLATSQGFSLEQLETALQEPSHEKNRLGKIYLAGLKFHIYEVDFDTRSATNKNIACLTLLKHIFQTISGIQLEEVYQELTTTSTEPLQKDPSQNPKEEKQQDIDVPFGGHTPEKAQASADLQAIDVAIDIFTTICEFLAIEEDPAAGQVNLDGEIVQYLMETAYPSLVHLLKFDHDRGAALALTEKLLLALNNLCWLFVASQTIPVAFHEKIPELWEATEVVSNNDDLETGRLCLNIFWALSKCLGPEVQSKASAEKVVQILNKCQEVIKMALQDEDPAPGLEFALSGIGFLGTLAQTISNVQLTGQIGEFLLEAISHFSQEKKCQKQGTEIVVESLNLIFDIFGDADYEYDLPVFVEGGYLSRLEGLESGVRGCYKRVDKHHNPELRARAEEAWSNLGRFIDYKRHERQ